MFPSLQDSDLAKENELLRRQLAESEQERHEIKFDLASALENIHQSTQTEEGLRLQLAEAQEAWAAWHGRCVETDRRLVTLQRDYDALREAAKPLYAGHELSQVHGADWCVMCKEDWPCDAANLRTALDAQTTQAVNDDHSDDTRG
jgi:hypothetical protein